MLEELRNLKSGELYMWRRQHRGEILEYLGEHGEAETMDRYHFFFKAPFRRFVEHEPPVSFKCDRFTRQDKSEMLANIAIAGTRENQKEIRELRELYQSFVDQVGEDITKKLLLPLLRLCIKLDNPIFALPPDKLSLDGLFGDKTEKPLELGTPSGPELVAEAEAIVSPLSSGPGEYLDSQIEAAKRKLIEAYILACREEDFYTALAIQLWLRELDCIYELDCEDEFPGNLEEWLARAEEPAELYVCC